jgi:hypothetical protein
VVIERESLGPDEDSEGRGEEAAAATSAAMDVATEAETWQPEVSPTSTGSDHDGQDTPGPPAVEMVAASVGIEVAMLSSNQDGLL